MTDPTSQVAAGLEYIQSRYGTPENAARRADEEDFTVVATPEEIAAAEDLLVEKYGSLATAQEHYDRTDDGS